MPIQDLGPRVFFTLQVNEAFMADPVECVVRQSPCNLNSHVGLAQVERRFKRIHVPTGNDPQHTVRGGTAKGDFFK